MNAEFVHYLESMVNLDALDRITMDLDSELKDSQKVMQDIKSMMDTLPVKLENEASQQGINGLRHEDISSFISAGTPKLLMSDMDDNTDDVNVDIVIATMKSYTEDLKKNFTITEIETEPKVSKEMESLDLEHYATSLDQLCKRLTNLKINKKDRVNNRSPELEGKLEILCADVNMFTKMVQAKTTLGETNKNWSPAQQKTNALEYDNLVNKLLSGINEVTYLLQNKN